MKEGKTKAVRFNYVNSDLQSCQFFSIGNHNIRLSEEVFFKEGYIPRDGFYEPPTKVYLTEEMIDEIVGNDQGIFMK